MSGKNSLFWSQSVSTVHLGREGMAPELSGHTARKQADEADTQWAHFLLFIHSYNPDHGQVPPTLGWVFPPQLA